jgi:ribonuclease R
VVLRTQMQARYSTDNIGHFGLNLARYAHFTSPIRRYADLTVHRILHIYLAGERDPSAYPAPDELEALCAEINTSAGTAARAESQLRKALWLTTLPHDPDTELPGRVTGVNDKGLFVTLDGGTVSGFLAARELRGRGWTLSDDGLALVSDDGRSLGFGEPLVVRIANADPQSGQLDLRPVGNLARPPARSRYPGRRPAPPS